MIAGLAGLAALLLTQVPGGEPPRSIVAAAYRAVEGDSAPALETVWARRVAHDSLDRAARLGLATLARLQYRYARGDSLFTALEVGTDIYAMYGGLGHAWSDLLRAPFDRTLYRALSLATRARAAGDSGAVAEALGIAGFLGSRLGALPQALDTLSLAEQWVPAAEPWLRALNLCTKAPILSYAGRPGAWVTGQRGLAMAKLSGHRRVIGQCYQALSIVAVNDTDDPALPERYADSAEAMQLAARDSIMLSITTFNRGYTRWSYGDLGGARKALHRAIREGEATDCIFTIAWSRRWLSAVHWQVGDLGPTLRDFTAAESLFHRMNDGFGIANTRNGRGFGLLAIGRVDEAEQVFQRGLENSKRSGVAEGIYANMVNLASVKSARGDYLGARQLLEEAIVYGNAHGHAGFTESLGYNLGILALRLGELDQAERYFLRADRLAAPTQYLDHFANHVRLAEVAARRGDLERTVRDMESAARQLDSARNALEDEQLKLLVFQTRSAFDEPDLGLAPIAELLVRGGRGADAFRLAEQRRARDLADRLLKEAFLRGGPVARPDRSGLPDVAELQRGIPEQTAVVEYLTGRNRQVTTAYVVTRNSVTAVVLPPADSLAADLDRFTAATERGEASSELGARLSAALLRPVLAALPPGVSELIVVPDGKLHRLPFDALPLEGGLPLLSRYSLSRAPSAVVALQLLPRPHHSGPARILAIGDPRFAGETRSPDPETEVYRSGYSETGGLPRLTGSSSEARAVARYSLSGMVRLRDRASEAYLKSPAVDSFQVIHFATHALVDDQSPSRSSLALTPGGGEDGFLGAAELGQLRISADLVVLSACRTAGGALIGGEGVQGLTAPLLVAGARAVVATLWPIGDRRTQLLVEDMYRNLAKGQTVGRALQEAKQSALARGESPAVWGAFTLVGDPYVRLSLVTPAPRWPLWLAGLVLLLGLGWLAIRRVRAPGSGFGSAS